MSGKNRFGSLRSDTSDDEPETKDRQNITRDLRKSNRTEFEKMKYINYVLYSICRIIDKLFALVYIVMKKAFGINFSLVGCLRKYDMWMENNKRFEIADRRKHIQIEKGKLEKQKNIIEKTKKQMKAEVKKNIQKKKDRMKINTPKKDDEATEATEYTQLGKVRFNSTMKFQTLNIKFYCRYKKEKLECVWQWDRVQRMGFLNVELTGECDDITFFKTEEMDDESKEIIIAVVNNTTKEICAQFLKIQKGDTKVVIAPVDVHDATNTLLEVKAGSKLAMNIRIDKITTSSGDDDGLHIFFRDANHVNFYKIDPSMIISYTTDQRGGRSIAVITLITKTDLPMGTFVISLPNASDNKKTILKNITQTTLGMLVEKQKIGELIFNVFQCLCRANYAPEFNIITKDD